LSTLALSTAKEVFDLLRDDLRAIERELGRDAVSDVAAITEIADYLREGGGKRIRPTLLLLAAKAQGYEGQGMVRLGAVVEMVHTATLVHDDIIDAADTRRGRPSANTTWGNAKCVLAGDWLYMQAFHIALEERNFRILDLLISLTQQMVEGELLQMETLGHAIGETEYFDLIYRKTACLFQVSMRLGSVLAGANEELEDQLGEYGRSLGMAFQIVDDVLPYRNRRAARQACRERSSRRQSHPGRHSFARERHGSRPRSHRQGASRPKLRTRRPR
jgi:octaprenyl-diphosphate synthase